MRQIARALVIAVPLALAGCLNSYQERQVGGALVGGTLGFITAKAFDADNDWVVVSTLAGAAAGTLVARNTARNRCAYATGDRRYRVARC